MVIEILTIILIFLFAVWVIMSMYKFAVLALVNLIIGGIILLRMMHDFKKKKNIAYYLVAVAISTVLFLIRESIGLGYLSRLLSRAMILEAVQVLALVFIIAQILLLFQRKKK
jgi:hypothetical protein